MPELSSHRNERRVPPPPPIDGHRNQPKDEPFESEVVFDSDEMGLEEEKGGESLAELAAAATVNMEKNFTAAETGMETSVASVETSTGLPPQDLAAAQNQFGMKEKLTAWFSKLKGLFQRKKAEIEQMASSATPKISLELNKQTEQATSPLAPGEIFDPEQELKNIRKLHGKEGQKAMRQFKEKLVYQRVGLARMQETLVKEIRQQPDRDFPQLNQIVENFAVQCGFTSEQKNTAQITLGKFREKHTVIKNILESSKNTKELFNKIFGRPPKGKVEIIQGPMTIFFKCRDPKDFTYIVTGAFQQNREPTTDELNNAEKFAGQKINKTRVPELDGLIIVGKYHESTSPLIKAAEEDSYVHEEQHSIKELFESQVKLPNLKDEWFFRVKNGEKSGGESDLKRYFEYGRQQAEEIARDEILAYLKGDNFSAEEAYEVLAEDEHYNKRMLEKKAEMIDELNRIWGKDSTAIIKKTADLVFGEDYKSLIRDGIKAFDKLKKNGLSSEQTIAILIQEPLTRWKRVANLLSDAAPDARDREENTEKQEKMAA